MDSDANGYIFHEDLVKCLLECKAPLSQEQVELLIENKDIDWNADYVYYPDLLQSINWQQPQQIIAQPSYLEVIDFIKWQVEHSNIDVIKQFKSHDPLH